MSNLISKILGNITTRIMFIIYITIILLTGFFIVFGYYNQLEVEEQRQYDKLKAVVTSVALGINGDEYAMMMNDHPNKDDITSYNQNIVYYEINEVLNKAMVANELQIPMYTLVYVPEKDVFHYGVRSDTQVYFRHEYTKYPPVLREKMNEGGSIPMYETENGIWLSAFHPIKNRNGEVVGLLEADVEFSYFKDMVNAKYTRQAIMALAVILIISLILIPYTRKILREDEKQKQLFLKQKLLIEESHREIKDSITYAKRIQNAILPPVKMFSESFAESFVLYKPKDIVAGDFYWFEKKNDRVLFAACDCTGHGVPGAMVSVICNNALNRAVREFGLTEPGKILDKTREIVIAEFDKSESEMKDGMDISLVSVIPSQNKIEWAGANNPLWLFKKDSNELIEFKPNKQPIGKYAAEIPFDTKVIEYNLGDTLFVFTDGFQDQFGGEHGKKLKSKAFKEFVQSMVGSSLNIQSKSLNDLFENWKGKLEQNDDVCVIGVRL